MYFLNQIVQRFKNFQQNHLQLKNGSFHYGYLDDVLKGKNDAFPVLVVTPKPKSVGDYDTFNFEVFIADITKPRQEGEIGLGNEIEVQSDTDQICKDLILYFKKADRNLTLNLPVPMEDFSAGGNSKEIAGWIMDFSLQQYNDHDFCAIPADDLSIPDSQEYATIYDLETLEDITTVRMRERYGVYSFSGIFGGTASTVFTNQIVGGTA